MSAEYFSGLQDHELYSDKVNHIYFYDEVSEHTVNIFQETLRAMLISERNEKGVFERPKPILIHVNSPGGDATYGITLMNFLTEIHVPFAVMIDGYAASAITPMCVAAPYRIMMDTGLFLIHEGSLFTYGSVEKVKWSMEWANQLFKQYTDAYIKNTAIPKAYLHELETRDKFIGAVECLKHKMIDRIIAVDHQHVKKRANKYYKMNPSYDFTTEKMLWKANFNHYIISNTMTEMVANDLLKYSTSSDNTKPIILHAKDWIDNIYSMLPFFTHIYLQSVPTIGIISNDISIMSALPVFACHKKYMYDTCSLRIHMVYNSDVLPGHTRFYDDIVDNYNLFKDIIVRIITAMCPKVSKAFLAKIFSVRMVLTAQDCLNEGLIDAIIKPITRKGDLVGCKFGQCGDKRKKIKPQQRPHSKAIAKRTTL
jgi:ATP-dependent protease ClpP protease subunit